MKDYTRFKGVNKIGDLQLMNQLQSNVVEFCNWGMLNIGAFYNVYLDTQLSYGGNPSKLRLCDDRRYQKGLIWEGFRNNWIWEQGVEYSPPPIQISGIYVNNIFYPTGNSDPTYAYNINYPLGRVVFDNPISPTSVVQCEFSYREYSFYSADSQWYHTLMQKLSRIDDFQYNWFGSSVWSVFSDSRISFPAVVVESVPTRTFRPKSLGGGQWCYQNVDFHIYASQAADRNIMLDILTYQNEKRFFMFDRNAMKASGAFPLNQYGYLVNPKYTYPYLVDNFTWRSAIIWNVTASPVDNENFDVFIGDVNMEMEIDFPEL